MITKKEKRELLEDFRHIMNIKDKKPRRKKRPTGDPREEDYTAWCECGDGLEAIQLEKTHAANHTVNGETNSYTISFKYYCSGCDKTYILTRLPASAEDDLI